MRATRNCVTEVALNGNSLGVRWYGRHDYATGSALAQGDNHLEISVVTTLFNCLWESREKAEPSGLLGPVRLITTLHQGVQYGEKNRE